MVFYLFLAYISTWQIFGSSPNKNDDQKTPIYFADDQFFNPRSPVRDNLTCNSDKDLAELANSDPNIKRLKLSENVTNLEPLKLLTELENVDTSNCTKIPSKQFNNLMHLEKLETLNCSGCTQLTNIKFLKNTPKLKNLYLVNCGKIKDLNPLLKNRSLVHLDTSTCNQLDHCTIEAFRTVLHEQGHNFTVLNCRKTKFGYRHVPVSPPKKRKRQFLHD